MKKSGKHQAGKKRKKPAPVASPIVPRRSVLGWAGVAAAGAAVGGGAGWWIVDGVRSVAAEQDLSRLGNGIATIVQVHDPQCALCTELQRETRKALRCFDEAQLQYLVASIKTDDGALFASGRGLGHVTLALINRRGDTVGILEGVRSSDELKPVFEAFLRRA